LFTCFAFAAAVDGHVVHSRSERDFIVKLRLSSPGRFSRLTVELAVRF
jgi:hypothetical protein